MIEFEIKELDLKGRIHGSAPVQAEGTIKGFRFYFRSRHDELSFAISEHQEIDPVDIQLKEQGERFGFHVEGKIGTAWEYKGSYLEHNEVQQMIIECCKRYLKIK